jgi:hypothetical protein
MAASRKDGNDDLRILGHGAVFVMGKDGGFVGDVSKPVGNK